MEKKFIKSEDLVMGKEYYLEDSMRAFGVFHHYGEKGNPCFTPIGGGMLASFTRNMNGYISFPKGEEFIEKSHYNIITADRV